jgi:hypothetical protein
MEAVDPGRAELERRLRQTAAALDFRTALKLWDELAERLEAEGKRGGLHRGDMEHIGELVRWVREVAIAANGQASDRVTEIRQSKRISEVYGAPEQRGPAVVRRSL